MATNTTRPLKDAKQRKFEALQAQTDAQFAKKMKGHVRFLGTESEPVKAVSEEFKKSARRAVN